MSAGTIVMGHAGPAGAAPGEPFTIYSSLPLRGDSQPQSEDIVRAMQMALDDHGGQAGGHPITYISLDDASPELGFWAREVVEANARRAAEDPTAVAYLGEFNSGATTFSLPILNEAGLLQVSPSNTYVGLTRAEGAEPGDPERFYPTGTRTYARVIPADHTQARAIVTSMLRKGCRSAYVLSDGLYPPTGLADLVAGDAEARGLTVVANEQFEAAAPNWRAAARRIQASGAGCFFFGGFAFSHASDLFKAIATGPREIRMWGADYIAESFFTNKLSPKAQRLTTLTNPTLPRDDYPAAGRAFFTAFEARYGRAPEPYAIYGYEAMSLVLDAIAAAPDAGTDETGRRAVVDAVFATSGRTSVLGRYDIDGLGDTTLPDFGAFKVVDGELVFDEVIR